MSSEKKPGDRNSSSLRASSLQYGPVLGSGHVSHKSKQRLPLPPPPPPPAHAQHQDTGDLDFELVPDFETTKPSRPSTLVSGAPSVTSPRPVVVIGEPTGELGGGGGPGKRHDKKESVSGTFCCIPVRGSTTTTTSADDKDSGSSDCDSLSSSPSSSSSSPDSSPLLSSSSSSKKPKNRKSVLLDDIRRPGSSSSSKSTGTQSDVGGGEARRRRTGSGLPHSHWRKGRISQTQRVEGQENGAQVWRGEQRLPHRMLLLIGLFLLFGLLICVAVIFAATRASTTGTRISERQQPLEPNSNVRRTTPTTDVRTVVFEPDLKSLKSQACPVDQTFVYLHMMEMDSRQEKKGKDATAGVFSGNNVVRLLREARLSCSFPAASRAGGIANGDIVLEVAQSLTPDVCDISNSPALSQSSGVWQYYVMRGSDFSVLVVYATRRNLSLLLSTMTKRSSFFPRTCTLFFEVK